MIGKVEEVYSISFSKQELYLILLHIVSSKQTKQTDRKDISLDFENKIKYFIKRISDDTGKNFYSDLELMKSLSLHLKIAATRIKFGMQIDNPFLNYVLENNFDLFVVLKNNIRYLFPKNYNVPDSEIGFIAIHFMASNERMKHKLRVFILCASGLGISQLLLQRVKNYFPNYEVLGTISLNDLDKIDKNKIDLIISTVNLKDKTDINYIVIDPLEDLSIAKKDLQNLDNRKLKKMTPHIQFEYQNCLFLNNVSSKNEVLEEVSKWLTNEGRARSNYLEVMLNREEIGSTYIGNGISLIHGNYSESKLPASLNIIKLDHEIKWDEQHNVDFLLNFIPTSYTRDDFALLFRKMGQTFDDKYFWNNLKKMKLHSIVNELNRKFKL